MKTKLMLSVFFLSLMGFSGASQAHECTAQLENSLGRPLESFTGQGWDEHSACDEAYRHCSEAMQWYQYRGDYHDHYRCNVRTGHYTPAPTPTPYPPYPPYPGPGGNTTCEASLRTQNGALLQIFYGQSYERGEACHEARRACQEELNYRQRSGQNPRAYCEISRVGDNGGGYNPPRAVTVQCRSGLFDNYGRQLQTFTGQGTGPDPQSARRTACDDSLRRCQSTRYVATFCRQLD